MYFKLRFPLSYRDVGEIMKMRGVHVDHSTIQRWVYKFIPFIYGIDEESKLRASSSWSMDETYYLTKKNEVQ